VLSVFLQTSQTQYWLDQTGVSYQLANDLDQWQARPGRRVALIEILNYDLESQQLIQHCCDHGDMVVLFMTELITDEWCQRFDLPNVVLFVNGRLNWIPSQASVYDCMYFFWSTCDFYKRFPEALQYNSSEAHKYFDVLLGRRKSHRDIIYNQIDHEKNLVTYFPTHEDTPIINYNQKEFVWPKILDTYDADVYFTAQEVTVQGVIVSLSQIIAQDLYQQTHYTLVAETQADNGWSFYTEKIAKPIIARRLFVVVSGQYYLRNLRNMGFKTFDGIIDESYDNEPDVVSRINMVLEQVKYLQDQDANTIKTQIQHILNHNFDVMMSGNWQHQLISQLKEVLE
jgi:hypothetical protein